MNSTFLLSGGAGRIICAIPALEKYHKQKPNDDFKVIVYGWESLYWNHPILQNRTYGIEQKGLFDLVIKNSFLKSPEPYHDYAYYNQKASLITSFDRIINHTTDHSDLPNKSNLYLHSNERSTVKKMIDDVKKQYNKNKFIVYQPYGSGAQLKDNEVFDASGRSLETNAAMELGYLLSKDAVVLFFGPNDFVHPADNFMLNAKNIPNADLRFYMAMIAESDYFVGIDSVGQHIARAFDIPGSVIMGSTFDENVTYPNYFDIYRTGIKPTYNPIRIGGPDTEFADRANDGIMNFSQQQIHNIYNNIMKVL